MSKTGKESRRYTPRTADQGQSEGQAGRLLKPLSKENSVEKEEVRVENG